jgi:DNA-directed RNA polymerase specialized sigma24 family protein
MTPDRSGVEGMRIMKQEVEQLRSGQINFATFVRITRPEWERLATRLLRSYRVPAGVELDDVVQEMVMSAWASVSDWDPKFGSDLTRYVTWNAYAKARRWVHGQRNSYRRSDHSPGRFPISESDWRGDKSESIALGDELAEPASEEAADARRIFSRIVCRLSDQKQAIALEAWATTGSSEAAAEFLNGDPKLVSALNIWTPKAARRLVSRAIESATQLVDGMA